jgi:hypothetical protein
MLRSRVQQRAFERLERCALKRARTVLRGLRVSNDPRLPDDVPKTPNCVRERIDRLQPE